MLFGIKLAVSLFLFKFRGEIFKISLASSLLSNFIKAMKSNVKLSTTKEQQEKLISRFAQMSRLINNALEDGSVSQEELNEMIKGNYKQSNNLAEIVGSFNSVKHIVSESDHFNEFLKNAKESWEANNLRNIKSSRGSQALSSDILKATTDSGGYYFIALTYLLNPVNLGEEIKRAIYSSGAWFQFLDDYRDRKEDVDQKNTLFTGSGILHKESLKKYIAESKAEIQKAIGEQNILTGFMGSLTSLVLLLDFTKHIFDWK